MPDASPSEGVVRYIRRASEELARHVPHALRRGGVSSIHKARVATRRLAAVLEIVRPLLEDRDHRRFARTLKKIRRSVQDLRDLDVMREHLRERGADPVARRVGLLLARERRDIFRQIRRESHPGKWLRSVGSLGAIVEELGKVDDRVHHRLLRSIGRQAGDFIREADRLSRRVPRKPGSGRGVNPHALRIAGKSLRYTLEIAQAMELGVDDAVLRVFKQLQDDLGRWHDYYVLSIKVADFGLGDMRGARYAQDADGLMMLTASLVKDSRRQLHQFARTWIKGRARMLRQIDQLASARQRAGVR